MIQEIKDFRPSKNIIMACLITGIYDVNRSETLEDDKYELVQHWAESIADLKLNGLIFHNNFRKNNRGRYFAFYFIIACSCKVHPIYHP